MPLKDGRIMYAYSGAGDIRVRIALMPEWLRVSFSDDGAEYVIDKRRDTSTSARIILGSVDNFHTEMRAGKPEYCMDFLYDEDLDVKGFLLQDKEATGKWEEFDEALKSLSKDPASTRPASGQHPASTRQAPGQHPASTRQAPGKHLRYSMQT